MTHEPSSPAGEPTPASASSPRPPAQVMYRAPREWTRTHVISPLLGGWPVIGLVATIVLYNRAPGWVGVDETTQVLTNTLTQAPLWFALGALVILGVTVGIAYLQWRVNKFRLGDDAIHQRSGLVFRQRRQAPLDRLQAIDVVQPLLARIFGFAVLKVEVAGGENSGISLEYLRLGDAEVMRNELLAIAAGVKRAKARGQSITAHAVAAQLVGGGEDSVHQAAAPSDGAAGAAGAAGADHDKEPQHSQHVGLFRGQRVSEDSLATPPAPEREIYRVPVGRLLGSLALSGPTLTIVSIPVLMGLGALALPFDIEVVIAAVLAGGLFSVLPALLGVVTFFWVRFNTGFGFRAALSQDGIRLRHGALETRRQTVPPGRVQAVRFHQSFFWRGKDWWRVSINVAGYQENQESVSTLLPVGTRDDALTALWLVLPDLGDPDPAGTVSAAMSGVGDGGGFISSPKRARIFDPLQWRQRGVRATDRALLIRRGRFAREVFVVPHERTQSLQLAQGPLQRWRGLATFVVHSTNGPVRPVAQHLSTADARALLESQAQRAAQSRKRQTPEQWMSAVGIADGEGDDA